MTYISVFNELSPSDSSQYGISGSYKIFVNKQNILTRNNSGGSTMSDGHFQWSYSTEGHVFIPVLLPVGDVINSFHFYVDTTDNAVMFAYLYKKQLGNPATGSLGFASGSGTAKRLISKTSINSTVEENYSYFFQFFTTDTGISTIFGGYLQMTANSLYIARS